MNPVALLHHVTDGDLSYDALMFWCPGCAHVADDGEVQGGLHMLPVNSATKTPQWTWNGSLETPTLSPSILTKNEYYTGPDTPKRLFVCHSFMVDGQLQFLGDCTHTYVGLVVSLPALPEWVTK